MKNSSYVRQVTRRQLADRYQPGGSNYGRRRGRLAYRQALARGYVCSLPAEGRACEPLALVPASDPLAAVVVSVRAGNGHFAVKELESKLGRPITDPWSLERLGRAGLALAAEPVDGQLALRPASPAPAVVANRARVGNCRRGWRTRHLVEAALPDRPLTRLTRRRRLAAAEVYENLGCDASELLDLGGYAHVRSDWSLD